MSHSRPLQAELQQEQQKKLFKYSKGTQEFLKQYKKPILQSAFDLQSRLTNQVRSAPCGCVCGEVPGHKEVC